MDKIKQKATNPTLSDPSDEQGRIRTTARSGKFIAVFDGLKFSKSTLMYAVQLAKNTNAFLTGLFLEDAIYHSYNAAEVLDKHTSAEKILRSLDKQDREKRDQAIKQFQTACDKAGIKYNYQQETETAIHVLKQESIFSDLIIISQHETFTRFTEKPPTRFISELLADVQCPVLAVPAQYKAIDRVTLLYDGGPSSVFAIKMFSYLLYGFDQVPVEILTVKERHGGTHVPNEKLMRGFIKRHFPEAAFQVRRGNAEEEIKGHLRNQKGDELVVLGAYRRSDVSRWFKSSMADVLMSKLKTPLFIAHNK